MRKLLTVGVVVATLLTVVSVAATASASPGRDVVRRGTCTGASHWKLDLSLQSTGRIEADMEVHSATAGQRWRFGFSDNGTWFAGGRKATQPDGSVDMHKTTANRTGTDHIKVRAKNLVTGEVCVGKAAF
jgi:hypothetical protein